MTGQCSGPCWFLEPGWGQAPVVVKQQLEEQDLRALLQPFWRSQSSPQSASQWTGPPCLIKMTLLQDPIGLFLIPVPASLHSLMPSCKISGLSLPLPGRNQIHTLSLMGT